MMTKPLKNGVSIYSLAPKMASSFTSPLRGRRKRRKGRRMKRWEKEESRIPTMRVSARLNILLK